MKLLDKFLRGTLSEKAAQFSEEKDKTCAHNGEIYDRVADFYDGKPPCPVPGEIICFGPQGWNKR